MMSGITTTIGGGGLIVGTLQIGNNAEVGLGGRYSIYFYFIFLSHFSPFIYSVAHSCLVSLLRVAPLYLATAP